MNEQLKAGFTYTVEVVDAAGNVTDSEVIKNLVPLEGLTHILNTVLKGGAPVGSWYIGVYEGNYTPDANDTMAAFPAAATESTAYTPSTRPAFTPGAISSGSVDNSAAKAELTFTSTKTLYGGFISSASAKGSTSGVLLSVVRFGSPKTLDAGSVLRVTAGFTMASA